MSDQFEVDTDELVEQLGEHQRLTGTEPKDESGGMSRRDLLLRGGAAAAAVSGVGAFAGAASAAPATKGKYTGTLRVITLGVEWPTPDTAAAAAPPFRRRSRRLIPPDSSLGSVPVRR